MRSAVAKMRARSPFDPTSWTYQALIHGIVMRIPKDTFINFVMFPNVPDSDPAKSLAGACWATCPHSRIEFLPWHRIYLHFLERILREASGDPAFVLPYWDYTSGGENVLLPKALRAPVGGTPLGNALYSIARDPEVNGVFGPPRPLAASDVDLAALREPVFEESRDGRAGFSNALENVPHNVIHGAVGGSDDVGFPLGDMASTNTAGRDPAFWLHHANVDRLWASWLRAGGETTADYADRGWYNTRWTFVDETGVRRELSLADLDTIQETDPLEYDRYEEIPRDPVPSEGMLLASAEARRVGEPLALSAEGVRVVFPNLSAEHNMGSGAPQFQARIVLTGVQSPVPFAITFDVFLNVEGRPNSQPVGSFNLFGIDHGGHAKKKRFIFDVTERVRTDMAAGRWPAEPAVTIRPRNGFIGSPVKVDSVDLIVGNP